MSVAAPSGLVVNRLRIVDGAGDALRARLAADRLLSAAEPEEHGVPDGAILVIRRLRGAMPAVDEVPLSSARVVGWRSGVEAALAHKRALAARPAHEPVPPSAEAVLFADHAELLACLAADWVEGVVFARWWWAALFRGPSTRPSHSVPVVDVLRSRASELPAVFELVARWRLAVEVARAVPSQAALSLAVAVAREHLVRGARAPDVATPGSAPDASEATGAPAESRAGREPAPWRDLVPEAQAPDLAAAQRLLLGVVLTIRREPLVARSKRFWPSIERWWREGAPARAQAAATSAAPRRTAASPRRIVTSPPHQPSHRDPRPLRFQPGADTPAESRDRYPPGNQPSSPSALPPPSQGDSSLDLGTYTDLAGVFYLLNVGLFLGLYGDFTSPREPGIALDPWDFAALLGRRLRDRDDPVWGLLAELSGHERPGTGFRAPRCWRVPSDWLEPFEPAPGSWRPMVSATRLEVLHPAGFVAVDVPASEDPLRQARRELARLDVSARPRRVHRALSGERPRGLERWVGWIAGYVRARLRLALGARTADGALATVLERPGTVRVTPARVDVTFALDDLPVAVRVAGLDRSPGWIPAAGRQLEFQFE
jgi:hypothetical protein